MKLAWLTDIHLDFLSLEAVERFAAGIAATKADAVAISGDISNGPLLGTHLAILARVIPSPIYFVLGNHDFYQASLTRIADEVRGLCERESRLIWLRDAGVVRLAEDVALIGHDGWYDGRHGSYWKTNVALNDFHLIEELRGKHGHDRLRLMQSLADEGAAYLETVLQDAMAACRRIVVVTHVPPFPACATYQGRPSDENWLPFFCCRSIGDVLRKAAAARPDREVLVLCGHSHGGSDVEILPNLRVRTGEAEYRRPVVQDVLDFGNPTEAT